MMDKPLGNQIFTALSYGERLPFRNGEQAAPGGAAMVLTAVASG